MLLVNNNFHFFSLQLNNLFMYVCTEGEDKKKRQRAKIFHFEVSLFFCVLQIERVKMNLGGGWDHT